MIDRSEAVNLARNWLDGDEHEGIGITYKGVKALAEAVLKMDEYIKAQSPEGKLGMVLVPADKLTYADCYRFGINPLSLPQIRGDQK